MSAQGLVLALVVAATTAQTSAPAPSATPPAAHLREIGHVRTTAACANIVVHANSAISGALRNDMTLQSTIQRLRAVDLNSNTISRRNGMADLSKLAADMRAEAVRADGEVKRLRDLAAKSTDETRKAELKTFADALGGALYKQKKAAMDVQGFIEYLSYEDMRDTPELHQMNQVTLETGSVKGYGHRSIIEEFVESGHDLGFKGDHGNLSYTEMAQAAARDFELRVPQIAADEAKAADHSAGAVSGC